jgi:hypothetical protein
MKALQHFEMSVKFYHFTGRKAPEDVNLDKCFMILIICMGVNIDGNLISWHGFGDLNVMYVLYFSLTRINT